MFYEIKSAGKCGCSSSRWSYDETLSSKAAVRNAAKGMRCRVVNILTVEGFKALEENGYKVRIRKEAFGRNWEAVCASKGF